MTTILDPNPATFSKFEPEDAEEMKSSLSKIIAERTSQSAAEEAMTSCKTGASVRSLDSGSGTRPESASKKYARGFHGVREDATEAKDFMTFMCEHNVGLIVRTNLLQERGMKKPSYDREKVLEYYIDHIDVQWADFKGGCPERHHVAKFLQATFQYMKIGGKDKSILIHCKGGFGRSIVLACLLIIERYDVPGEIVLAWVRMMRTGAINTIAQENLVASMRSREDVWRFARLHVPGEDDEDVKPMSP